MADAMDTRDDGGRPSLRLALCTAWTSSRIASTSSSTAAAELRRDMSTDRPSSLLPLLKSHRGDSGRKTKPTSCTAPGTRARPTLTLHSCPALSMPRWFATRVKPAAGLSGEVMSGCSPTLTSPAMNWPVTTLRSFRTSKKPRRSGGAASEMYMGTVTVAMPIATPRSTRPRQLVRTLRRSASVSAGKHCCVPVSST
eukprot:scaffold1655_cov247-Pinguiococcus_pyrenoidosus.AAC.21